SPGTGAALACGCPRCWSGAPWPGWSRTGTSRLGPPRSPDPTCRPSHGSPSRGTRLGCRVLRLSQPWFGATRTPPRVPRLSQPSFRPPALAEPADLLAQLGGLLVGLLVDRLDELPAELHQLGLRLAGLRHPPRRLAAVPRLAVDVLQERRQLLAELVVVVGAA